MLKVLPLSVSDSIEQNRRWQAATNVTASKKGGGARSHSFTKGCSTLLEQQWRQSFTGVGEWVDWSGGSKNDALYDLASV